MGWEDDDEVEEETLMGLTSDNFSVVLSYMMPLLFFSIFGYLAFSIFTKPTKAKEVAEAEYKKSTRAASDAEEGGVLEKVAKSVKRAFVGVGAEEEEVKKPLKAPLSCIPFGCPDARMAASFAMDSSSGAAFLYGGFDENGFRSDMHYYNTSRFEWKTVKQQVAPEGEEPGKRVHVRMTVAGNFVCMFGGSSDEQDCTDDLFAMNIRTSPLAWKRIGGGAQQEASDFPVPQARYGHAMCSVRDIVVVFGGLGQNEIYFNDMWFLDTSNNFSWEYVKPSGNYWPKGRDSHAICGLEDIGALVLYGGFDGVSDGLIPPGIIEVFEFEKGTWEEMAVCGVGPRGAGVNGAIHALGNGSMKAITISEKNGGIFNQMHILDYGEKPWSWSEIEMEWRGDWTMIPGQRSYFSSCYDAQDGLIYVFGGKSGSAGGEGMMHNTLVCVNVSEAAGVVEEEEVEGRGEVKGGGGEEEIIGGDRLKEVIRGSMLPGSGRFKGQGGSAAKKYK